MDQTVRTCKTAELHDGEIKTQCAEDYQVKNQREIAFIDLEQLLRYPRKLTEDSKTLPKQVIFHFVMEAMEALMVSNASQALLQLSWKEGLNFATAKTEVKTE
jgi:hypothetical protein